MRFTRHFVLFTIVLLVLFGLLVFPGLASEPKAPLPPYTAPSFTGQLTFTPVATIYLPIILLPSTPPSGCDFYEPDDTPGQANLIQDGETQIHCIKPKTDTDWVKFFVDTESQIIIEISTGSDDDTELYLYDSKLNEIEHDYGIGEFSRIDRECGTGRDPLEEGLYYAMVEQWFNWREILNYSISLSIDPCPTLAVLTNRSHYTYTYGELVVVGELQNNGQMSTKSVRVVANLFNSGNQLIDTGTDTAELDVLQSGEKTCFRVGFSEYDEWAHYEFEAPTYYSSGDEPLQNMAIYNDNGTYDSGSYRILGFVRNDNSVVVKSTQIIVTLYDIAGVVVGCGSVYANNDDLSPGQSSSFEVEFSGYYRDYVDVASYRLQVDGYPQ